MRDFAATVELEMLCERLLIDAFALQDDPEWATLSQLLQSTAKIASFLQERESAFSWAELQLLAERK